MCSGWHLILACIALPGGGGAASPFAVASPWPRVHRGPLAGSRGCGVRREQQLPPPLRQCPPRLRTELVQAGAERSSHRDKLKPDSMLSHKLKLSLRPSDAMGIVASTLCVIHCAAAPLLVSSTGFLARLVPGEEWTHRALVVAVAAFGLAALVRGYGVHRRRRVPALMVAGFACISLGAFFGEELAAFLPEIAVTMVGSVLLIASHVANYRLRRACSVCEPCLVHRSAS